MKECLCDVASDSFIIIIIIIIVIVVIIIHLSCIRDFVTLTSWSTERTALNFPAKSILNRRNKNTNFHLFVKMGRLRVSV